MTTRLISDSLTAAITELVIDYSARHKKLDVDRAAFALWTIHPECPMTLREIATAIEGAARECDPGILDRHHAAEPAKHHH